MDQSLEPKRVLGHPAGLFFLFFAELWERFSFYGMRALLTLYMVQSLFRDLANGETKAIGIYAAYGSLVYFTPVIGGIMADKYIGYKKSIMLGAVLMALGHFAMAIENDWFFYGALALLIVGNGFFKPNISSMVGGLYKEGDPKRDAGFTIFYMGINIGAFLAPLVCGWLGYAYGWHYGFGAAGIGMLLGLVIFVIGTRNKRIFGVVGDQPKLYREKKVGGMNVNIWVILFSLVLVPIMGIMVVKNDLELLGTDLMTVILIGVLVPILGFLIYTMTKSSKQEWQRLVVVVVLTFFITIFWSFFEQAGTSLTLFAERNVNLVLMNASQTNSINPGYIMLLAIPFSMVWTWLGKIKANPITPVKFALGILQLGLGFFLFALSANQMDLTGKVPFFYLIVGYFFITTGEMFISPIGLSKVTELSPKTITAFMMGVYFLSSSFAHHIAGAIAKLTVPASSGEEYVEEKGILIKIAQSATGTNQNAVGKFSFNYDNAYTALSDTNYHDKIVTVKEKLGKDELGEAKELRGASFSKVDKQLEKLEEESGKHYARVDTAYELITERMTLPEKASVDKMTSSLTMMKEVNKTWAESFVGINEQGTKINPFINTIKEQAINDSTGVDRTLLAQYIDYKVRFYEKKAISGISDSYNLLSGEFEKNGKKIALGTEAFNTQKEKMTESAVGKVNFKKAEEFIALEKQMKATNATFSDAVHGYIDAVETNRSSVNSLQSLATYTKVFAQIAIIALFFCILAFVLTPWLKRWMHGIH